MLDFIDQASFMAHGYCLLWQPWLVTLFAGSDLMIFAAYSAIPLALVSFLRQRPDLAERRVVRLFAAFILLCGTTHLLGIVTLWFPAYPVLGVLKFATGVVSIVTAIVLFRMIPRLVLLPHPRDLEGANAKLRDEIAAHEATLEELRAMQRNLEGLVDDRTSELDQSNRRLRVLMREMAHRSRNLLGVVQSIARQSARFAPDLDRFVPQFGARLQVLAEATNEMATTEDQRETDLGDVLRRQIAPYEMSYPERITLDGAKISVGTEIAGQIALVVHELATNAVKYGALSQERGRVRLGWRSEEDGALTLDWTEEGDGPADLDAASANGGFGTMLLTRAVPGTLDAREVSYEPTPTGLRYRLVIPASALHPTGPADSQTPDAMEAEPGPDPLPQPI
ncbi:sensor histidine kinase [Roseobacter sp. HKCCA0434]|uniref:sensor histidine kinase n=1 Tax=Roseobacter sp. HKCCA0434 TaxID=3079297 RepID=UPI002905E01B|nr:sensor histidine kinase [Roseobacter sp. HKCCA0434]